MALTLSVASLAMKSSESDSNSYLFQNLAQKATTNNSPPSTYTNIKNPDKRSRRSTTTTSTTHYSKHRGTPIMCGKRKSTSPNVDAMSTPPTSNYLFKLPLYKPNLVLSTPPSTPAGSPRPSSSSSSSSFSGSSWDSSDDEDNEPEPIGVDGVRKCCNCCIPISVSSEVYTCIDGRRRWFCISCPSPRRRVRKTTRSSIATSSIDATPSQHQQRWGQLRNQIQHQLQQPNPDHCRQCNEIARSLKPRVLIPKKRYPPRRTTTPTLSNTSKRNLDLELTKHFR